MKQTTPSIKFGTVAIGVVALGVTLGACSTSDEPDAAAAVSVGDSVRDDAVTTSAEKEAVESAQSYVDLTGFSKSGLVEQLTFEGFSTEDATYAANHIDVDWTAEADESAVSYVTSMSFSRSGLIDQLEFDGFTSAQAKHGADQAGL